MYLHLGQHTLLPADSIIGVFDMDTATQSRITRDTLALMQKRGDVREADPGELPASFIVTDRATYLSPITAHTLYQRSLSKNYI